MDVSSAIALAQTVTARYLDQQWAAVRGAFDDELRRDLTETRLAAGWRLLRRTVGRVDRIADTTVVETSGDRVVVDVSVWFRQWRVLRSERVLRFTVDDDRIADLLIVRPRRRRST